MKVSDHESKNKKSKTKDQHIAKPQISHSKRPAIAVWVKVDGVQLSETKAVVKMGSILLKVVSTLDVQKECLICEILIGFNIDSICWVNIDELII